MSEYRTRKTRVINLNLSRKILYDDDVLIVRKIVMDHHTKKVIVFTNKRELTFRSKFNFVDLIID